MIRYNLRKHSKGAVLVEASIVLFVFLGLVGACMYWILTLHYRHALSEGMTYTIRKASSNVNTQQYPNPSYSYTVLQTNISQQIIDYLTSSSLISDPASITINQAQVCKDTNSGDCRLIVEASVANPCYLCLLHGLNNVTIRVESGIEDACFRTPSVISPTRGCYNPSIPDCT
jgi:hypothetical protein